MKFGLEIHQRLNASKLFCQCPSEEGKSEPKRLVRMLHPVYSEMGEVDKAAVEAAEREQMFEYLFYGNCNCLVELDEEPPHPMNREALKIGLEIAQNLKSRPVSEVHTMRKIVIDGSNTSGFQRTAVISLGGKVESPNGDVRISTVAIEEESAGIVERKDGRAVYSLDRLGIPLVEIGTEPDIKSPAHLKEIAEKLGLILRATGKVMRGLGTIRQDVNVSIEGGARVEIKGAQDLKTISLLAENEVKRQQNLLSIISEIKKRAGGKIHLEGKILDLSSAFVGTQAKLLKAGLESGQRVLGMKIENHAGILGKEINAGRRYGTELSDYAKTAGVKGIIHSDEDLGKYGITPGESEEIRKLLHVKKEDAFVLVVAKEGVAKKAVEKALERARMDYIPKETRKANEDGTSSYMRPLPGKARLYPETDIPPVKITQELIASFAEGASESVEEKREKLSKLLNKEMAERILRSKQLKFFEKLVEEGIEPMLVASTLEDTITMLRRENVTVDEQMLAALFAAYKKGEFVKAAIPDVLRSIASGASIEKALDEKQLRKISGAELKRIVQENGGNMAAIMAKYRLRVDSKEVSELIARK
ncbi:Glutamyl-tRNA(Gln) amidotransferase subunit E [uncultured archaeon]|nr:Glutamyl-tRNA(Gln) amidotransferase subunit E [uncultured archaeon]